MPVGRLRMVRDYNRGLPWPVRTTHLVLAALTTPLIPLWNWASVDHRRWWARPTLLTAAFFLILLPLDGILLRAALALPLGGDAKRVLNWYGEFGQGGMVILLAILVWLLDRANARRLLDYLLALGLAAVATLPMKMLVGRPRPRPRFSGFYDHWSFLGPWGAHPFDEHVGVRHAWEFWADISSDLWSMPSSHTVYAVVTCVWIAAVYPRLKALAWALAAIVGLSRVLFGAHYPTDVLVGVLLGYLVATPCITRLWGVRLIDWAWQIGVDPEAAPAATRFPPHFPTHPAPAPGSPSGPSPQTPMATSDRVTRSTQGMNGPTGQGAPGGVN